MNQERCERKRKTRALEDFIASVETLCEAENAVLAADDDIANRKREASEAARILDEALLNPDVPLEEARTRKIETVAALEEARTRKIKADDARDEAFDAMIECKDHCAKLLAETLARQAERENREAVNPVVETNDALNREDTKAEAASEELHDTDMHVTGVLMAVLGKRSREMMPPERLIAEMRTVVDAKRAKYPKIQTVRIVDWPSLRESLLRLDRLGYFVVDLSETLVTFWRGPRLIVEPEAGFPEEGKCLNDVGNPECRIYTNKDKHGEHYTRCYPCNKIFQKRRDAKPVKPEPEPEPDDSGTLFEKQEPEPEPVPVPASAVMLEAKPEADDLAVLLRNGKVDEFLASAGHWYSTRFTRGLVLRLKANKAKPGALQLFWVILTVLEGLGKDNAPIVLKTMRALSGLHPSTISASRTWLMDFDYITWDKNDNAYGIGPGVSDVIDDDTPDGKEHWHSTRYSLDVSAQLKADGVGVPTRIMFWAILASLEGLGIKSGRFPNTTISEAIARDGNMVGYHAGILSELGWISYTPGSRDMGATPAAWPTFGLGSRLTNE